MVFRQTDRDLEFCARKVETLREMVKLQCENGTWNYDSYMHGMANGMIYALSLFEGGNPVFLSAPEKWRRDMPTSLLEES